jgi:hypothetical protein
MKRLILAALVLVLAASGAAQATYSQQATLAVDATFQQQIEVAMLQAAANVMSEAVTVQGHVQRAQFAVLVIQGPTKWQPIVSMLIASQGNNPMTPLTVPSTVADSLIQTAVNAQWSNLSGYFAQ